jgi:hypothetical protein
MALVCKLCRWRPPEDLPTEVVVAHFAEEHDTDKVSLDLVAICRRCDREMVFERSIGRRDIFTCDPCQVGRAITIRGE